MRKEWSVSEYCKSVCCTTGAQYLTNKLSVFEDLNNLSACEMNEDMIQKFVSENSALTYYSMTCFKSLLATYCKWCRRQNIPVTFNIQNIDFSDNTLVDTIWFKSPKNLKSELDKILPQEFEEMHGIRLHAYRTERLVRAMCWLVFAGVDFYSIQKMRVCDIDLKHRTVWDGNNEMWFPDEAMEDIEYAVNCCTQQNDLIFISWRTKKPIAYSAFRQTINHKRSDGSPYFQVFNIKYSGVLYRIYLYEINGSDFDFDGYIADVVNREGRTYSSAQVKTKSIRRLSMYLRVDYGRWKKKFYGTTE